VPQRERGRRAHQFLEQARFARDAESERHLDGRFDRVDQLVGRESAAVFRRHHFVRLRDDERSGLRGDALADDRLHLRHAPFGRQRFLREKRDRRRDRVAVDDLVENAELFGLAGGVRVALEHELQRGLGADQAREALRAARTRKQAELDFGKTGLGAFGREAIVARQRQLEAAAERVAVDCDGVDLLAALDRRDDVANRLGLGRRFGREVVDVGAAAEDAVGAGEDHRFYRRVVLGRFDRGQQVGRIGERERVHRRIVEGQDPNPVAILHVKLCHLMP